MGEYERQFYEVLSGDDVARTAIAKIMAAFKVVRRSRPGHTMTVGDVDAVLAFPLLFTFDLPANAFWVRHAHTLGPQLQLAVMDWVESAEHAPTTPYDRVVTEDGKRRWVAAKEREVSTRGTIYSFAVHAVVLGGGDPTGVRESLADLMAED